MRRSIYWSTLRRYEGEALFLTGQTQNYCTTMSQRDLQFRKPPRISHVERHQWDSPQGLSPPLPPHPTRMRREQREPSYSKQVNNPSLLRMPQIGFYWHLLSSLQIEKTSSGLTLPWEGNISLEKTVDTLVSPGPSYERSRWKTWCGVGACFWFSLRCSFVWWVYCLEAFFKL